jgi:hypothetical protein
VLIGVPGVGFRGDLRADNPVVQGGRTFAPVLTEHDYYRSELEQIEVFAPLVPIDRIWVEDVRPAPSTATAPLDHPPPAGPIPAVQSFGLTGRRAVHRVADGFVRDLRFLSESYPGPSGEPCVRMCAEAEWYLWAFRGATPRAIEVPAADAWAE